MAIAEANKPYFTFVKGLITEASPLTFPENASIDEDNFDLQRDGSRSRRLGMDYEDTYALVDSGQTLTGINNSAICIQKWENVNNDPTQVIGVTQIGSKLFFLDLSVDNPSGNVLNSGTGLDLAGSSSKTIRITSALGGAILSIDGSDLAFLTYNSVGDTVTSNEIDLKIRDFFGVTDDLDVDEHPATLSNEHYYNLVNQGWTLSKINEYSGSLHATWAGSTSIAVNQFIRPAAANGFYYRAIVAGTTDSTEPVWPLSIGASVADNTVTWICEGTYTVGEFPSNADIWHLGKDGDDKFDTALLKRQYFGTSSAPKGSVIIDAFTRGISREAKLLADSGLSKTLPTDEELKFPLITASYAGRVFYAGVESSVNDGDTRSPRYNGFIIFTKLLRSEEELGICYQEADPTSEHISDIIATDGGTINIPEVGNILELVPIGSSLIVIADNGCWEIFGGDIGFTATDIQISKIANISPVGRDSIVVASGAIFLWAKSGIYLLSPDQVSGRMSANNITEQTIQTKYDQIPSVGRETSVGAFDSAARKVSWLYNDDLSYTGTTEINKYNRELIFDTVLGAFYTKTLGVTITDPPYVAFSIELPNSLATTFQDLVLVDGDQVQADGDDVIVGTQVSAVGATKLKYLTVKPNSTGNVTFTLSLYNDINFKDWVIDDSTGVDASAFMIPGYELLGDAARNKQAKYITFHFNRTETGFQIVSGVLEAIGASSCTVQPRWDFSDSANSGKFGTSFEAYKLKRNYIPTGVGDPFDYGQVVISTKNKVRGTGRAFSMRLSTTAGKDCQPLGWEGSFIGQTDV